MKLLTLFFLTLYPILSMADIRIGVLANRGAEVVYKTWSKSQSYLEKELSTEVKIIPLKFNQISEAISSKQVDYILMNPILYVQSESKFGIKKILTTHRYYRGKPQKTFGSVLFSKADKNFSKTYLQNAKIAAVDKNSLGGWLAGRYELETNGVAIDEKNVIFKHDHYDVVDEVLAGRADIGVVRTGVLSELIDRGVLDKSSIQILFPKKDADYLFLSSKRYPSWPLASLPHVETEDENRLALALLKINIFVPEYAKKIGFEWGLPHTYKVINELLRFFKKYPYNKKGYVSLQDFYLNNKGIIYTIALVLAVLIVLLIVSRIDLKRKKYFHRVIAKERDELKKFLDFLPTPVLLLDHNFEIIRINKAFTAFLKKDEREILGHKIKDYIRGIHCDSFIQALLSKGTVRYIEDIYIKREDESLVPITLEAFTHHFEDKPISVITISDLSFQKQLTTLQQEWEVRRQEEEKIKSVGILGSGIAHEINNPLTIISSSVMVLKKYLQKERFDTDKWAKMLDDVDHAGERIGSIIKALRLLGQDEDDSPEEYQKIGNFFNSALVLVSAKFLAKGIAIHFSYDLVTEMAYYSHAKMHQYLVNILINAEKVLENSEEKWIRIDLEKIDESFFLIKISNSGLKIKGEIVDNIFIPFVSGDSAVTGKGMSLAQTKVYLNKRHGDIWLDREAPHTTFIIKYPFDHRQIV